MSMTYSGDPANSKKDNVRFVLGDTDTSFALLTDEEINFALMQKEDNVMAAAIICCLAIVASLSKQCQYKVGPEYVYANQRRDQYKALYEDLQTMNLQDYGVPTGVLPEDNTSAFAVGMMDN